MYLMWTIMQFTTLPEVLYYVHELEQKQLLLGLNLTLSIVKFIIIFTWGDIARFNAVRPYRNSTTFT